MARVQNSRKQFQRRQTKRGVDGQVIEQILMTINKFLKNDFNSHIKLKDKHDDQSLYQNCEVRLTLGTAGRIMQLFSNSSFLFSWKPKPLCSKELFLST